MLKKIYRTIMKISPIIWGHHSRYSFGFYLLPIFRKTLGFVQFGKTWCVHKKGFLIIDEKPNDNISPFSYRWGFKIVNTNELHNCSWTGKY
jgi:hypothetical protein